jgi:hypothetical protein
MLQLAGVFTMLKLQREPAKNSARYDETLAKLESLKREHKEFLNGHRRALYSFLQRAAEAAISVEADENATVRFRKKMDEKDVLRGTLIFVFDAKTKSEMKEASKRTQALRYLIDKLKVAVEDIAVAIPKHGGIEKLARLAAKSRKDEADEEQEEEEGDSQDEEAVEEENFGADRKFDDQIRMEVPPKLTRKLNRFSDRARIKIIGYIRASSDESPMIEVKKIIELKVKTKAAKKGKVKAPRQKDDDGDWE